MRPAVVFDNVSKKFARGERHDSLRDLIPSLARRVVRRRNPAELGAHEFWALRHVSFEVRPGEALGIIGTNGAGKSTTLKLLTRILRPTEGHCAIHGRTGALIEVAAGFHPELTGRENVFMQGAIMGMKRAEIAERIEAIVDFAGVRSFIDTPTKRYSSGMNARLGFSVAAHLNPDVLVIDEVLAVGDTEFQQRCMMRMLEFKRNGVAIVFVSHNLNAVAELCSSAILLDSGRIQASGSPRDVVNAYLSRAGSTASAAAASKKLVLSRAVVSEVGNESAPTIPSGARCRLEMSFVANAAVRDVAFAFYFRQAQSDAVVYAADSRLIGSDLVSFAPGEEVQVTVDFVCNLLRGAYYLQILAFHPGSREEFERKSPVAFFEVTESSSHAGSAALFATCTTSRAAGDARPGALVGG
jgi:lipopolysaccharide transport system ATP-binding protein